MIGMHEIIESSLLSPMFGDVVHAYHALLPQIFWMHDCSKLLKVSLTNLVGVLLREVILS